MGLKLKAEETLPEGLKRIAREELDDAIARLRGEQGSDVEERVHEARKSFKKTRAAIRLVRKEVGGDVYDRENGRFRDAGRLLAPVRDAGVFVATLDTLTSTGAIKRTDLAPIRKQLQEHRERTRQRVIEEEGALERVAAIAEEGRAMVDSWPIERVDSKAFRKSLRKTYKRGRKAFASAYEDPRPESFHELRKRVKYLWYYSRFLKPAASNEIDELKDLGDEASDLLGLDHDLAELIAAVDEHADADKELSERLQRVVDQERLRLQWEAYPLLRRTFSDSPKAFAKRTATLYDVWRFETERRPTIWLTGASAEHARALLERKADATDSKADAIRAELRAAGLELSELSRLVAGAGAGFGPAHLDELIERGVVAVGDASDFARPHVDRLLHTAVDVGPNEASGICPIDSERALEACGWDLGFWVVLDETAVEEGIVAVGRSRSSGLGWEARRLPVSADGFPATDDAEDCVRVGEWVYVFGSHFGSKEGPLERERQFVARFREAQLADGAVDLHVSRTGYRMHRLINDALADADLETFPLAQEARGALVGRALADEEGSEGEREERIRPDDLPINIEGCALRSETGTVLVGLRFPTSAGGHPLLVEIDGLERIFDGGDPEVTGIWELGGIGSRWVPAGIRGLTESHDGSIEAITGNLDSAGKDSVLIDAHPEAALAQSAHFRLRAPEGRSGGRIEGELIREFPGFKRIEGVAKDPLGRFFYVIDEEDHVDLRYSEPIGVESRPSE